jgi:hypothetical protein
MENSAIYLVWTCLGFCFVRNCEGWLNVDEFDFGNQVFVEMHMDSLGVGMGYGRVDL